MAVASAYPNYRQPKMRWLPAVPEHWSEQRAKTFFREVDERSKTGQEELLSVSHLTGVTPRSQKKVTMFKAASYVGSKLCRPGDIVINTLWAWMAALGASRHVGIVSPAYGVYRPHRADSFNPAYLDYLLRTRAYVAEYIGRSTGVQSSRLRLYPNQFLDIALIQPPRPEQDQIVAYLRAQDAHIARFIKAKRELIKLLTEQKQTIIEGAITQGLDAATEKRDSGIDWIPRIPAHWETCKLKHVATFNPSRSESTAFRLNDASVSFLPMECITADGRLQSVESRKTSEVWEGYTYFRRNDVVMAKITPCFENGKGGLLDRLPTEIGFGTTEFIVLRAAERRIRPAFLATLLSLKTFRVLGADAMTGAAGQQRVPLGFVKNFGIALPSLDEQDRILGALQTATVEQDVAIERIRSEIALLHEYRDRLIADVVTGQVNVRGWQPGPDDVVDDAALAALGDNQEDVTEEEDGDGEETDAKMGPTTPTPSAVQQAAGQRTALPTTGQGEFLLYQTEDAQTRVQVRFEAGDVWLTQQQLADLYQSSPQNITQHIRAIYQTGELQEEATCKPYLQVRLERGRQVSRSLKHYNLEVALAIGYRAKSHRGTQFRRWATEQLQTYLRKGVLLDDERFKRGDDTEYFEELLARIRDIRSSEKVFWRKVLDIYATSLDYDPHTETSQQFFATVQNKMHWAAHGHTAAELIAQRVDAQAPNMGLTHWAGASKGGPVRKADVGIAKNYLNAEELDTLNRIVTAYIEVAQLQAQAHQAMTMRDWATELDNFLRLTRKDILTDAGKVQAKTALAKAEAAYAEYQARVRNLPSPVEKDFEAAIAQPVKQLERGRKAQPRQKKGEDA